MNHQETSRRTKLLPSLLVAFALLATACGTSATNTTLAETTAELVDEAPDATAEPAAQEPEPAAPAAAPTVEPANEVEPTTEPEPTAEPEPTPEPQQSEPQAPPAAGSPAGRPDGQTGLLSSAASPAEVGQPFLWNEGLDEIAEFTVHGLIISDSKLDEGTCLTIFYTATAVSPHPTLLLSDPEIRLGVRADGTYHDDSGYCAAEEDAEGAGFGLPLQEALPGVPISRTSSVLIAGESAPNLESIVVGFPDIDEVLTYIEPTVLDAIPPVPRATGPLDLPAGPNMSEATAVAAGGGTDLWDLTFQGVVISEPANIVDSPDVCVSVVGDITLTETAAATTGDWEPRVDIIAGGLGGRSGVNTCAAAELDALGYRTIRRAELSVGSTYNFAESFLVAADLVEDISTVLIDEAEGRGSLQAFQAETIDINEVLPATLTGGTVLAAEAGSITGAEFTWIDPESGISFDVAIAGLVEGDRTRFGAANCYIVVGTITPDGDVSSARLAPDFSLLASGHSAESYNICSQGDAEDAGYQSLLSLREGGVAFPFYETLQLFDTPTREFEGIIVGRRDGEQLIFEPDLLDDIPPAS